MCVHVRNKTPFEMAKFVDTLHMQVCCSTLQRVAVCCSVLQYVAVCCSEDEVCCSVLQCVAESVIAFTHKCAMLHMYVTHTHESCRMSLVT